MRKGTSFIDLVVSMGIIAVLFGGIYLIYFSLVTSIANISVRTAAATAVNAEIETIRNLPYDSVGTVGGVPPGVIPQTQSMTVGKYTFNLQTIVRSIDDPFDGTLGGTPNDTSPADYKLVQIQATCLFCTSYVAVTVTTTVAPKNLESATQNGSLFIYALNANGNPLSGASIHVVNASVTPSIDLTDTTNAAGVLQLVGVPTSSQSYAITATKAGYSTDQTYPPGAPSNPNPVKPYATVAAQTVTSVTFAIDTLSQLSVVTSDNRCASIPNESFSIQGSKLIGTSPNVLKFSTTTATTASGSIALANLEWDTYTLTSNDAARNVAGTIPVSPITVNPSSTLNFRFVLQPAANPSLLVTTVDAATGAAVVNTAVTAVATGGGFSKTLTAGHAFITQNNWSAGQFSGKSAGIDVSNPSKVILLVNASGTYPVMSNDWLISNTFDLGGSSSTLYGISWQGTGNLSFQIAANNDNATWNFVGPDGTAGTSFTTSSSSLPAALSGNRYVRYKVYLNSPTGITTPELDVLTLEFSANCVPQAQVLFTSMPQGTYTVTASAVNYNAASSTVSVGAGSQAATVSLLHL